jgi:hypothetical protein
MRGKSVKVSDEGLVPFHNMMVEEANLDMNWCHHHNMVQPIVKDALGWLTIKGSWRTTTLMHFQLGSILEDTHRVRVDG